MNVRLLGVVSISLYAVVLSLQASDAKDGSFRGFIVDKQCADSVRNDADPSMFIQHHTRDCALMPNCKVKGYSVYSNGAWLDLDKKGNDRAIKLIKESKQRSGFYVEVMGLKQQNILKVRGMKEIDDLKPDAHAEVK